MSNARAKIYFDGSHYIAIPRTAQSWKKRKNILKSVANEINKKVEKTYKNKSNLKTKKERIEATIEELDKKIKNKEISKQIVNENVEN